MDSELVISPQEKQGTSLDQGSLLLTFPILSLLFFSHRKAPEDSEEANPPAAISECVGSLLKNPIKTETLQANSLLFCKIKQPPLLFSMNKVHYFKMANFMVVCKIFH